MTRKTALAGPAANPGSRLRIPRITRLMALAIKFQGMVDRGEIRDYVDLARLGHVTRARMSQIMNLLNLAPEIQEELLELASTPAPAPRLAERHVRSITGIVAWPKQRLAWANLREDSGLPKHVIQALPVHCRT